MTNPNHTDTSRSGDLVAVMKDQIESWEFEDPRESWWKWQHQYAQAADRIEQLEREKAVVSDLWEQQKEIALDYLADCNKAADRIKALEAENERLEERLGEAYQIAGHIAAEYDGNGQIERLLDLLAGVNLGEKG